ncbi:hypothetical protein CUC43_32890 (plasmid) [Bacillus thuringiensis LM1212]|uniref:hypothetical protein n=1 Tax=Bacillus cereus group TaxID=86661 RepID=UPI000410EECC|nr:MULTISPECIES: hypothetical protein [Bacillus cereus group]AXY11402.1 hypothetical protein CUC43_32890 [Bacillus thuringiensis LM1212]QDF27305.1 hypothetical protein FJR70_31520 [Bacillus tropicus]QUG99178.1 hypothetical protein HCM98_30585 [Bacillus tropicus]
MQITNPLQQILQVYGKQVTAGREVMIGLTNGVVVLQSGGVGEAPIVIRVDEVDEHLDMTIQDVFGA